MYHPDREIRDKEIIKAILVMCDVITVSFNGDGFPYALPLNFGFEYGEDLVFYTHHAPEGHKNKFIEKKPKVCVTAHRFIDNIYNEYDNSHHDYRSVTAFGEMSFIPRESAEFTAAFESLCRHNGRTVPASVYGPGFNALAAKIVCRGENVTGKAQRRIARPEDVPFKYNK